MTTAPTPTQAIFVNEVEERIRALGVQVRHAYRRGIWAVAAVGDAGEFLALAASPSLGEALGDLVFALEQRLVPLEQRPGGPKVRTLREAEDAMAYEPASEDPDLTGPV